MITVHTYLVGNIIDEIKTFEESINLKYLSLIYVLEKFRMDDIKPV